MDAKFEFGWRCLEMSRMVAPISDEGLSKTTPAAVPLFCVIHPVVAHYDSRDGEGGMRYTSLEEMKRESEIRRLSRYGSSFREL